MPVPPPASLPRRFLLVRHEDITGVSGLGIVAEGVRFSDGWVALRWYGATPCVSVWDSMLALLSAHGHGGRTIVEWLDAAE